MISVDIVFNAYNVHVITNMRALGSAPKLA